MIGSLEEGDVTYVDCDQQRFLHKLVIAFVTIHPTLGWHDDSVDITVI